MRSPPADRMPRCIKAPHTLTISSAAFSASVEPGLMPLTPVLLLPLALVLALILVLTPVLLLLLALILALILVLTPALLLLLVLILILPPPTAASTTTSASTYRPHGLPVAVKLFNFAMQLVDGKSCALFIARRVLFSVFLPPYSN